MSSVCNWICCQLRSGKKYSIFNNIIISFDSLRVLMLQKNLNWNSFERIWWKNYASNAHYITSWQQCDMRKQSQASKIFMSLLPDLIRSSFITEAALFSLIKGTRLVFSFLFMTPFFHFHLIWDLCSAGFGAFL